MQPDRPDPDQLLAEVQAREASARRGRLRIYFGASPGVGKTYAMLAAARALRDEGRDVVVGVVETHGRKETEALLQDLEVLPLADVSFHGRALREFDLDAAQKRHPALILVDELAHTNAPGSRHAKRWQDVDELLSSGIDVFTSLNVQHLESLNDVVGGITGITVRETVPDTIFDDADEVMLVDIPADDLLARLKAGKVYVPEQIERAARNFFRKGNLMALRELALRRTADRVEDDVQAYRSDKAIERVWKTEASLLCCVGPGAGADHVVRSTARLAGQLGVEWTAVYVETPALQRLPTGDRERILRTLKLAQDLGARTAILSGEHPARSIVDYARTHNCSKVIVGRAAEGPRVATGAGRCPGRSPLLASDVDVIEIGRGEASAPAVAATDVETPSGEDPRSRRKVHALRVDRRRVPRDHAAGHGPAAVLRSRQHRDAVPADGGARRGAARTRTGGARRVRQCRRVRLLLRAAALFVRRDRRPVRADLRRHAGRRAHHRADDRRACATRRASPPTARSAPARSTNSRATCRACCRPNR